MINTSLLKSKLNESGLKTSYIAKSLNITKQSFYNKLNNRNDFTVEQAFKIQDLLGLDSSDLRNIFFADNITFNVIKEASDER